MKTFIDTTNQQPWQFDDDVVVHGNQFFAPHDLVHPLNVPATLVPAELPTPPVPTIDDLKASKTAEVNARFEAESAVLTAGYPESEQKTWPSQEAEALAWQADNTVPTPYLDAIAADRHIAPEDMRARTLAKVVFFKTESASLLGIKQRLSDAIIAAQEPAALDVITWPDQSTSSQSVS